MGRALARTTLGDGRALLRLPQLNGRGGEGRETRALTPRKQEVFLPLLRAEVLFHRMWPVKQACSRACHANLGGRGGTGCGSEWWIANAAAWLKTHHPPVSPRAHRGSV